MTKLIKTDRPDELVFVKGFTWNELVDRLRKELFPQPTQQEKFQRPDEPVKVRNKIGRKLPAFSIVELGPALPGDDEDHPNYLNRHVFEGLASNENSKFIAVLQRGMPKNTIARVKINGVSTARVRIRDLNHKYCKPSFEAGKLESTDKCTQIQLLHIPITAMTDDVVRCKVNLVQVSCCDDHCWIDEDDPELFVANVVATEGDDTHAVFILSLSKPAIDDVDLSLSLQDGTAQAPGDYTASTEVSTDATIWVSASTVTISQGETTVYARVPIIDDGLTPEDDEKFTLTADVTDGTTANDQAIGTCTIVDNPPPAGGPCQDGNPTSLTENFTTLPAWAPSSWYAIDNGELKTNGSNSGIGYFPVVDKISRGATAPTFAWGQITLIDSDAIQEVPTLNNGSYVHGIFFEPATAIGQIILAQRIEMFGGGILGSAYYWKYSTQPWNLINGVTPATGDVVRIEVEPLTEFRLLINGTERATATQYTAGTSFCGFRFGPYYERPFSGDFWWDDLTSGFTI